MNNLDTLIVKIGSFGRTADVLGIHRDTLRKYRAGENNGEMLRLRIEYYSNALQDKTPIDLKDKTVKEIQTITCV